MSRKDPLDHLSVTSPCLEDWNSMTGNDQVRFCEHCSRAVHNVSEMSRTDALRLIRRSQGRLCVRYYRDPNGELLTRAASAKFHQITRHASRIAAGAFSATLSLSSAVVRASDDQRPRVAYSSEMQQGMRSEGATVRGRISDPHGAVVPAATISIGTQDGSIQLYANTNENGEFMFENVQVGNYSVHIEARGFAPLDSQAYVANGELRLDYTLNLPTIQETVEIQSHGTATMGVVVVAQPDDPFILAASQDDVETLESLLAGRDVNLRDKRSGTTALEHAVENSNRELVQLLLARGADVNAKDSSGKTVLMMLENDATSELVWDLINAGADVNAQDQNGETPLIYAASDNNLEAMKTLLDAGAKVELTNGRKQTALMIAASSGVTNNVRLLLLAGSPLQAVDEDGKNALSYAEEQNHRAVIRLLRSQGALAVAKTDDDEE